MEYTYTHTLAVNSLSHAIMSLHLWEQSFPHLIQATGDCLLTTLKWIFLRGSYSTPA